MGLAASQARLLFITSRQNDVSAQMQHISNQTMILARDEDEVSTKYNQMLASAESTDSTSGTALVDSSTSTPTNLTYDYMMGAEGASTYSSPYIIKDAGNRVVLSSDVANKLSGLGGATSGTAAEFKSKYPNATDFIKAVAGEEIASAYNTGSSNSGTTGTMSVNDLLSQLNGASSNGSSSSFNGEAININFGGKTTTISFSGGTTSTEFNDLANSNSNINVFKESSNGITAYYGASDKLPGYDGKWKNRRVNDVEKKTISISDLYAGAGNMSTSIMLGSASRTSGKSLPDLTGIKSNLSDLTNNIGSQIASALAGLGFDADAAQTSVSKSVTSVYNNYSNNVYWDEGKGKDDGDGDVYDTSSKWAEVRKSAFAYVDKIGKDGTNWNEVFDDGNQTYNEGAVAIGMMGATGLHGIVATRCSDEGNNDTWQFTLNLGNLVQDIVNGLMNTISGGTTYNDQKGAIYDSDMNNIKKVNQSKEVSVKLSTSKSTTTSADKSNAQKANYFANIYESLCASGWVVDNDANDYSKLQEKIKNGTYTINGTTASNTSNISEVKKTYTKEDAEAYWKTEMTKIQRKEKQLDTQLTKLQTEYSSLTNDYNSVKSILDANIQKSFVYCQNG